MGSSGLVHTHLTYPFFIIITVEVTPVDTQTSQIIVHTLNYKQHNTFTHINEFNPLHPYYHYTGIQWNIVMSFEDGATWSKTEEKKKAAVMKNYIMNDDDAFTVMCSINMAHKQ